MNLRRAALKRFPETRNNNKVEQIRHVLSPDLHVFANSSETVVPTSAKDLTYMKIYTLAYGLTLTRHSQNVIFETLHGYKPVRASIYYIFGKNVNYVLEKIPVWIFLCGYEM